LLQRTPQTEDEVRGGRLSRSIWLAQVGIGTAYLYDSLILFGFSWAGFLPLRIAVAISAALAFLTAVVAGTHWSGWSRRRKDRTLFLPQQLYAIGVALMAAIVAPQIGFQPFATLFAISAFSFMAPNPKSLLVCWTAAASGAVAVIFLDGGRLAMPTSTIAGQALTAAVVVGILARCLWVSVFFRGLQRRLAEKNSALKLAVARIEGMANRDELTGLSNRRSITRHLTEQMAQSDRTLTPLSVAILDIDHFKRINDTYGHLAGDRTLQLFGAAVTEVLRATDRLGRYGGEEFLVVLLGASLKDTAAPLERIRARIAASDWSVIGADVHLTLTIGATQYAQGESVENLLRRADLALYLGKESGRDRVVLNSTVIDRLTS
jgi:diguanylate cyclase (GGDEF)-like protein